jgi:hypothetical protein
VFQDCLGVAASTSNHSNLIFFVIDRLSFRLALYAVEREAQCLRTSRVTHAFECVSRLCYSDCGDKFNEKLA